MLEPIILAQIFWTGIATASPYVLMTLGFALMAVAALLEQARSRFEEQGVVCELIEREGKPAFVICDVADELNADVIVMGTRGLSLEAEEAPSTASRVIQLAPCPVLVVP